MSGSMEDTVVAECEQDVPANVKELKSMDLKTVDKAKLKDALVRIRKAVSVPTKPPLSEVLAEDPIPTFVAILGEKDYPEDVIHETIWILTNLASGTSDQTKEVVQKGGLDAALPHLEHDSVTVAEQVLWLVGNVCGDCVEYRDMILLAGGAKKVIASYNKHTTNKTATSSFLANVYWVVSNLLRGKPLPKMSLASPLADFVMDHIIRLDPSQSDLDYTDLFWAASYLSESDFFAAKFSKSPLFLRALVEKGVSSTSSTVPTPAARAVGQLCTGDDTMTQAVVDAGVIPSAARLFLSTSKVGLCRELMWLFSNIAAGSPAQIKALSECDVAKAAIVQGLKHQSLQVVVEALFVTVNPFTSHDQTWKPDETMLSAMVHALVKAAHHRSFDMHIGSLLHRLLQLRDGRLTTKEVDAFAAVDWEPLIDVLKDSSASNASSLLDNLKSFTGIVNDVGQDDNQARGAAGQGAQRSSSYEGQVAAHTDKIAGQLDKLKL